jgi:hypothetical protein
MRVNSRGGSGEIHSTMARTIKKRVVSDLRVVNPGPLETFPYEPSGESI